MIWLLPVSWADSPLTATPIWRASLEDDSIVQYARTLSAQEDEEGNKGVLTPELAATLTRGKKNLAQKAAVINALGWHIEGKNNHDIYLRSLKRRRRASPETLMAEPWRLRPHEAFVAGYLLALDDYFHPQRALPLLYSAAERLPESYTVAMVVALTEAQVNMPTSWCTVWTTVAAVPQRPDLRRDLPVAADQIILDYIILYRPECEDGETEDTDLPDDEWRDRWADAADRDPLQLEVEVTSPSPFPAPD